MVSKKSKPRNKSKKEMMLEKPDVASWYDNTVQGSSATADVYVRRLYAVCERLEITTQDLVIMEKDARYNLLLKFVKEEGERGMSGSYIASSLKAIRSWLAHKGIKIERKIKVRGADSTPTLENERVPRQMELHRIFLAANPRELVCCVLIAHSGVRPEVLGNYEGHDGLTFGDFPEMKIENNAIVFEKIPTKVVVRSKLSKTRKKYFTFLSSEGCDYLKQYLDTRLKKGEKFTDRTDIITPIRRKKQFITSIKISDLIRKAIRTAGYKWRPYVLRAYCDTQLLLAESKGKLTHAYRQFFMGHAGDMEARYTVNKSNLPQELIEDMRESYKNSETFLHTTIIDGDESMEARMRRQMLKICGMSDEEIEEIKLEEINDDEIAGLIRKKFVSLVTGNGGNQKVVGMDEVEKYISEGWKFVSSLPPNKAIIKLSA